MRYMLCVNFQDVFLDHITNVPAEREVELSIEFVPCTSLVLLAPYGTSMSELVELRKQLEELVEKNLFF